MAPHGSGYPGQRAPEAQVADRDAAREGGRPVPVRENSSVLLRAARNQKRGPCFRSVAGRRALRAAAVRMLAARAGVSSGVAWELLPGRTRVPAAGPSGLRWAGAPEREPPGCTAGRPLRVSAGEGGAVMAKAQVPARARRSRKRRRRGAARAVPVRPPTAPGDFSQNWKALQEMLRRKPQAPEEPLPAPRVPPSGRQPEADPAPGPAGPPTAAQRPAGGVKRTDGDLCPRRKKQKAKEAAPAPPTEEDIWFDDVDPEDIEAAVGPEAARIARARLGRKRSGVTLVKEQAFGGLTRALAMDCEMVGVGPEGKESIVARVSIVNQYGKCVYDKFVKPTEPVTDYRTAVSGVRPENLKQGAELEAVQKEVAGILQGRILVGHALHNDLKVPPSWRWPCDPRPSLRRSSHVLFLDHPKKKIRDTQKYRPFRREVKSGRPSLKLLSERILGLRVQQAEHCSIQDAQVAMRLYVMVKKEWERPAPPGAARKNCSRDA
ncbi:RNA exonuclease 4 [Lepus europaeus]|uniref:RNA exonuclease 4 n=1 Tax=Lepus europaeus TaxID=9983 RepID=UPI002B4775B4|nr:RNA exonuclease 4 [Lepus europaeus]